MTAIMIVFALIALIPLLEHRLPVPELKGCGRNEQCEPAAGRDNTDGYPMPNLAEYQRVAGDFKKLEATGLFPVRSAARIAAAFSQESLWEPGLHPKHFRQPYTEAVLQAHKALFRLNMEYNMVSLAEMKKNYELLIIPGHVVMGKSAAETVRRFAEEGGTVLMTGYSAVTNETGRAFDSPCPGILEDVFGLRVAGFSRAGMPGPDGARVPESREILFPGETVRAGLEYTERLELRGAECIAEFENGEPAAVVHSWGRGKAVYLAAETSQAVLKKLIRMLLPSPEVPEGVQRREIGQGAEFLVNLTPREIRACSQRRPGRPFRGDLRGEDCPAALRRGAGNQMKTIEQSQLFDTVRCHGGRFLRGPKGSAEREEKAG